MVGHTTTGMAYTHLHARAVVPAGQMHTLCTLCTHTHTHSDLLCLWGESL